MATTFYITSGKGGTGKSTFTANLGLTFAIKGKKVILLDMNMGMRDLDLYIGVQNNAIFDVYDVIMRTCEPDDAILNSGINKNLFIIPAHQGKEWIDISMEDINELIDHLAKSFDIIIMDGAPGINSAVDICVEAANHVIMITTPDYAAIRDADALEDFLIRKEIFNRHYIVNKVMPELEQTGCEPKLSEIDGRFRSELLGVIMDDRNIRASCNLGIPIVLKRNTYISKNFDKIADRLIEEILE